MAEQKRRDTTLYFFLMNIALRILNNEKLKSFAYGGGGVVLRPIHRVAVSSLMSGLQFIHRRQVEEHYDSALDREVTIVVKTFLRPKTISRFVKSARQIFRGKIIVVDDSPQPWAAKDPQVQVIHLPFDVGVSAGRNAGVKAVKTPFTIISDDDYVFTRVTDWSLALDYLKRNPEVTGVAATVIEIPRGYSIDFDGYKIFHGALPPLYPSGTMIDSYPVKQVVANVFLARTEALKQFTWDERLKICEHVDFFSATSGKLVFVLADDVIVYHARTPWNKKYAAFRNNAENAESYRKIYRQKWLAIARGEAKPQGH